MVEIMKLLFGHSKMQSDLIEILPLQLPIVPLEVYTSPKILTPIGSFEIEGTISSFESS